MVLYIESPKTHYKTDRIYKLNKSARYKVNIQKSVAFLNSNIELLEKLRN